MSVPTTIILRVRDYYQAVFLRDPEDSETYWTAGQELGIAGGEAQAAIDVLLARGELELVHIEKMDGGYYAYRFRDLEQVALDALAEIRPTVGPRSRLSPLADISRQLIVR
jgi:hypothetical protein